MNIFTHGLESVLIDRSHSALWQCADNVSVCSSFVTVDVQ